MAMPLHVAAAELRLGELTLDTARKLDAEARLSELGVAAPSAFADMLVPGVRTAR
jgi:hypothetical protein